MRTNLATRCYSVTDESFFFIGAVVEETANGAGDLGFDYQAGQVDTVPPTACQRCDVSLELCYPGAKQRKQPATRFTLRRNGVTKI